MYILKKSKQRFCSCKCQNEWQKTNINEKNPKFSRVLCKCESCGKMICKPKYVLESGRHIFCSPDCRKKWFSEVFSQSPEWKEESRIRGARIMRERQQSKNITVTKPQLIMNSILDGLGISYENEAVFCYYAVDNYLFENKLIIEVMGDFWHSTPIKYSKEKIREYQLKVISRDKAKHTYIKNKHGIEILYVWETDLYKNRDLCVELVKAYIKNKGLLSNYNSFNYHMDNGHLVMNNEIIYPYQAA